MQGTARWVDESNREQLQAWDGDEGAYWAAHADRFDRAVAHYQPHLLRAAAIDSGDRVLDIGCGTGQTTRDAARQAPAGSALGIDLSAQMVAHARRRALAEGVDNAAFEQADAQVHPFADAGFDLVISRTGTMFFGAPTAAFTNISRALPSGGRLAMLTWQPLAKNEWIRELTSALAAGGEPPSPPANAPGPFALSDPKRVREILDAASFTSIELCPVEADMWFGADPDDAADFVVGLLGWMLHGADDATRARALASLHRTVINHHTNDGVVFESAGWITTATRA